MPRSTRLAVVVGLVAVTLMAASADDKPSKDRVERGPLEGTWEHTFKDAPEHRQVKIINQTHFVWVTYVREDGMPLLVGARSHWT